MMLSKAAERLTMRLLKSNTITLEETEVYVYGFELLISFFISTAVILILGIVFHAFLPTIAFLAVFIALRGLSGGFHARTYWMCSLVTFSVYGLSLLLSYLLPVHTISYLALAVIGTVLLAMYAPIEHPNKEISPTQKKKFKLLSVVVFLFFVTVGLLIKKVNASVGYVVFYSLIADIMLLFIKNKKGG